jgi:hypothetical protein
MKDWWKRRNKRPHRIHEIPPGPREGRIGGKEATGTRNLMKFVEDQKEREETSMGQEDQKERGEMKDW